FSEEMDHSSMDHGSMDHGTMDHSSMNHGDGKEDHSAHRAAIAAKYSDNNYSRSESSYDLKSIELLRMDDQLVKLADELGTDSPVLLNFIFTSCATVCPVLTATFSSFQKKLGDEAKNVTMISISIDPQYDRPGKLREYAKLFNAGSQWKFYTGSDEQSISVQKAFGAYRGSKMNHIPLTFLRAAGAGSKWVKLEGFTSSSDLVKEFRSLSNS
ncbi:MAG: SCO family protein, partial [Gammaproteobacteria bacterium]|nr:SCO family protein [Gammaproteobacteria bacterium]